METHNNTTRVEEYLRGITTMMNTKGSRFKIDLPLEKLESYLTIAYHYQVYMKNGEYKEDEKTKAAIHEIADSLTSGETKCGFMFCGNVGNGKTTMMLALKQCLTWLRDADLIPDFLGYVVFNAKDISREMKGFMTFDELCRTDCLGIDDLGGEPLEQMVYGSVHTPIVDLLEKRYDRRLFTVVTTNLSKEERQQRYGERLFDRFNEMFRNIVFKEGSYRGN